MDSKFRHNDDIEAVLTGVLYRASCPESDLLLQFSLAQLRPFDARQVEQHLGECPHCSAEIATLTLASRTDQWLEKVKSWLRSLLGDAPYTTATPLPTTQLAIGLKGDGDQQTIYESDPFRVSLSVVEGMVAGDERVVEGSVVNMHDPLQEFAGTIHLLREDAGHQHEQIDEFGYFSIPDLAPGTYTLLLTLSDHNIWLKSFTIP